MEMGHVMAIVFTGIAIVFLALVILILFVSLMGKVFGISFGKKPNKSSTQKAEIKKTTDVKPVVAPVVEEGISDEIVAVISAAVATMSSNTQGTNFVLRGIKKSKLNTRSAWAMAGIQDNTHSF